MPTKNTTGSPLFMVHMIWCSLSHLADSFVQNDQLAVLPQENAGQRHTL